jgi:hypothetical protein
VPGTYRQTGKGPYRTQAGVWPASTVVRPGDLIFRNGSGYDAPAATVTWDTDLATTQETFHDTFRGIASAGRRSDQATAGDRGDGMIVSTGEFEYPCAALGAAVAAGAFVGPAKQTGDLLENQKVVVVATANLAIGRVSEDAATGATSLKVEIEATLLTGGPRALS